MAFLLLAIFALLPSTALALSNNNKIIDQNNALYNGVDANAIQRFLSNSGTQLANYTIPTAFDVYYPIGQGQWDKVSVPQSWQSASELEVYYGKSVAQLVAEWASTSRTNRGANSSPGQINPLVALATLDKESASIIGNYRSDIVSSRPITMSWLMGYGFNDRMDACIKTGDCDVDYNRQRAIYYGGPGQQIVEGTSALKRWSKTPTPLNSCTDIWQNMTIEGQCLNLENTITYALYRYTPTFSGNTLFADRFNKISGTFNLAAIPSPPTILPLDGSLVKVPGDPKVYLIEEGKKRHISSLPAFVSYGFSWDDLTVITSDQLAQYSDGDELLIRPGTIIRSASNSKVYAVDLSGTTLQKRWITTGATFASLGYQNRNILAVDDTDIAALADGADITTASTHTSGALIKVAGDAKVYVVENGQKRHIPSLPVFISQGYRWDDVLTVSQAELDGYSVGADVPFRERTILKASGDPKVYVVDIVSGVAQKRWLSTLQAFEGLRYTWNRVLPIAQDELPAANGADVQ